jgi:hypothetical protein
MSSLAMKRMVATALAGATIASTIGASPVSARPIEQFVPGATAGSVDPQSVPPPPSSIAAPAGEAYGELRSSDRTPAEPTGDPQQVSGEPSGFDPVSAAIGAAAGAGLVIVVLAAGGLARRRPLTRRHGTIGA